MKLILSTANIMSSGQSIVRRPLFSKSNVELINGLRSNIVSSQNHAQHHTQSLQPSGSRPSSPPTYLQWTTQQDDTLYIPAWRPTPLAEPRDSYDITVKLFYLPGIPASHRCQHTREAIDHVLRELSVDSIDLLIISYPGVSFDAEDDIDDDDGDDNKYTEVEAPKVDTNSQTPNRHRISPPSAATDQGPGTDTESLDSQLATWRTLESLHPSPLRSLGVAEFSSDRLSHFLPGVSVRPKVDQINVKDCCVVPKDLIVYARENGIELLTHNDCTDVLPAGTTRELLGPGEKNARILAATAAAVAAATTTAEGHVQKREATEAVAKDESLEGDIEPQWVVKYTAVIRDRGVIENKGYIAAAQLRSGA